VGAEEPGDRLGAAAEVPAARPGAEAEDPAERVGVDAADLRGEPAARRAAIKYSERRDKPRLCTAGTGWYAGALRGPAKSGDYGKRIQHAA